MEAAGNYIAGEWIASARGRRGHQSVEHARRRRLVRARRCDGGRAAIAAAKQAFPAWSRSVIQQRHDILKRIGDEILARKDELGRLLAREEGKTLAEARRRGRARRPDLPVLRRRMPAAGRREDRFGAPGHRHRGHARAGRRRRAHHALEFPIAIPAWKIAPALAYGNCVVFKPADLVPGTAHALSKIIARPASRPACSIWSWDAARS